MPRRFTERYGLPAARAAAPVLPDLSRQNAVNARLGQFPLENAARQAALARAQSSEAQSQYKLNKEIETDRQKAAFYNGLQELESTLGKQGYGIGTKQHSEAFAAYAHEFPLARSTKDVQDTLKVHALVNDDQAALTNRMNQAVQAGQALGLTPQGASFVKGGNVDVRFTQPGTMTDALGRRYAHVLGSAAQYTTAQQADIARQRDANIAAGKANVPYNPNLDAESRLINSNLAGAQAEQSQLEAAHPNLTGQQTVQPTIPQPAVAPQTPVAPQAQVAPTSTPIDHQAAIDWATANPNDARSQPILQAAQAAIAAQQPVQSQPAPTEEETPTEDQGESGEE